MVAIPDEVRDSILEKFLAYIKCENLTEQQIWRMHLFQRAFKEYQIILLRDSLTHRNMQDLKTLYKRDKNDNLPVE